MEIKIVKLFKFLYMSDFNNHLYRLLEIDNFIVII